MNNFFDVYRKKESELEFTLIAKIKDIYKFVDTDCEIGKLYTYYVENTYTGFISSESTHIASNDNHIKFVERFFDSSRKYDSVVISSPTESINNNSIYSSGGSATMIYTTYNNNRMIYMRAGANKLQYNITQPLDFEDFTIEMIYGYINGANGRIMSFMLSGNNGAFLVDRHNSSDGKSFGLSFLINYSSWIQYTSSKFSSNPYTHICIQRKNGTIYAYIDGELCLSRHEPNYQMYHKRFNLNGWPGSSDHVPGSYGNCRITKGVCRYNHLGFELDEVTLYDEEADPLYDNVILYIKNTYNSSVNDVSKYNVTYSSTGSVLTMFPVHPTNKEYSLYNDGGTCPRIDINPLSTSDFTFEFDVHISTYWSSIPRLYELGGSAIEGHLVGVFSISSGMCSFDHHICTGGSYKAILGGSFPISEYTKICIMRKNGTFYTYLNGILTNLNSNYSTVSLYGTFINILSGISNNMSIYGAASNIRLTRYARYEGNEIVQDNYQLLTRNDEDTYIDYIISKLSFEEESVELIDGGNWTSSNALISSAEYSKGTRSLDVSYGYISKLLNRTINGDFKISFRLNFKNGYSQDFIDLFRYSNIVIRFGNADYGNLLQFSFNDSLDAEIYSSQIDKEYFITNTGWHLLELQRLNGICRMFLNGNLIQINSGLIPTEFPLNQIEYTESILGNDTTEIKLANNLNGFIDEFKFFEPKLLLSGPNIYEVEEIETGRNLKWNFDSEDEYIIYRRNEGEDYVYLLGKTFDKHFLDETTDLVNCVYIVESPRYNMKSIEFIFNVVQ